MASERTLQTHLKSAAAHLEALGYKCLGVRDGKKRDFYLFQYSEECKASLLHYEASFRAIQSLEYVTAPPSPGNKEQ
jgi:hypothetical protein